MPFLKKRNGIFYLLKLFSYTIGLENTDQDDIALYRLNKESNEWIPLDNQVVNWNKKTVSGKTNELTKFVLLAKEKQEESSSYQK